MSIGTGTAPMIAQNAIPKLPIPAKLDTSFIGQHANDITKKFAGGNKSWFDKLWGKMDKDKMREIGVGLINQSLMQQQQRTPMAPFQPGMGGGGMAQGGGGQPELVALAQQLGLNKVL